MNKHKWSLWINANMEKADMYTPLGKVNTEVIPVNRLRHKIERLPEEKELLVIPQFVADTIKEYRGYGYKTLYTVFVDVERGQGRGEFEDWFLNDGNYEIFCRAWLDNYEIEPNPVDDITEKLVNHIQSDDFEDILRSSVRAFIIRDGIK